MWFDPSLLSAVAGGMGVWGCDNIMCDCDMLIAGERNRERDQERSREIKRDQERSREIKRERDRGRDITCVIERSTVRTIAYIQVKMPFESSNIPGSAPIFPDRTSAN